MSRNGKLSGLQKVSIVAKEHYNVQSKCETKDRDGNIRRIRELQLELPENMGEAQT